MKPCLISRTLGRLAPAVVLGLLLLATMSACGKRDKVASPEPTPAPTPSLSTIDPDSLEAGQEVALTGLHFGADGGKVLFGTREGSLVSWSESRVVVNVPTLAETDSVSVEVDGHASNKLAYVVVQALPALVIEQLDPSSAPVNTIITVKGHGFVFPRDTPEMKVSFTGATGRLEGRVTAWNEQGIRVWVPAGTINGPVRVEAGPRKSNDVQFTVITG